MKNLLIFAAAVTVSTSVLAGNMSDNKDMKAMHSQMMEKSSIEEILKNEEMQRLHRDMTRNAMSEGGFEARVQDRKSTRLNSSHVRISYAVFCLKKKKKNQKHKYIII